MEVYETIRTVLAIRAFQSKPVSGAIVHRIIESARLTASSQNGQPWHFIVVENRDTLVKLGSIVNSGRSNAIAQAAFAVVVAIDKSSKFGVSDASRAIQSMVLTAWSEGIGSNWTGWVGMTKVGSLLEVPRNLDVIAVVPFGYPIRTHIIGKKRRKEISDVVHYERFGKPYLFDVQR